MKAYQVFARMSPERATALLAALREHSPAVYTQAVAAASAVMKARPRFLMRMPEEKRAQMVRRSLARVASSDLGEEILATYFLGTRKELLVEWLDLVGLEHEEGTLQADRPPCPPEEALDAAIASFRSAAQEGDAADRELLLQAFAAQTAIDWPALDERLAPA